MSNENEDNTTELPEAAEAVETDTGPRNEANARASDRIAQKADRRANRKLPTSGSDDSTPDPAEDEPE